MNISYQLISQHFSPELISKFLEQGDRLPYSFRYQDLRVEFWHNCIWTNYGMISYRDYANYIYYLTECKALELPVRKINDRLYLAKGRIKDWYAVHDGKCECMLSQLRRKRSTELPQFFKHLKVNCHHELATELYEYSW